MKTIVVRFINDHGPISRAIDFVSGGYLCHVELGLPDGGWIGARAAGGVQARPANYSRPSVDLRYALPVTDAQYARIMHYAADQIGTKYNFADIVGILFRSRLTSPHRVICSQFVMDCFQAGGVQLLNVLPTYTYKVTPEMVHLSPLFIGRRMRGA